MELVRLYGVGGLAGAVNPANLKTHLGVFLMLRPTNGHNHMTPLR